jgi:hypothetical protein
LSVAGAWFCVGGAIWAHADEPTIASAMSEVIIRFIFILMFTVSTSLSLCYPTLTSCGLGFECGWAVWPVLVRRGKPNTKRSDESGRVVEDRIRRHFCKSPSRANKLAWGYPGGPKPVLRTYRATRTLDLCRDVWEENTDRCEASAWMIGKRRDRSSAFALSAVSVILTCIILRTNVLAGP